MRTSIIAWIIPLWVVFGSGCDMSSGLKRSSTNSWEVRKVTTRDLSGKKGPSVTLQFEVPKSTTRVLGFDELQGLHPIYGKLSETRYLIQLSFEQKEFDDWKKFSEMALRESNACVLCLHPMSFQDVEGTPHHFNHWLALYHRQVDVMDTQFLRYYRRDFKEAGLFVKCEVEYRKFVSMNKGLHGFADEDDKTIRRIMNSIKIVSYNGMDSH